MIASLFRKIRVALTPRSSILETRLDNGARVSGLNHAGYGGRGIYIFRDSLEPELAALARFVKPGHVFLDVGANVGVFSMKAAKEVGPDGLVVALEPFIGIAQQFWRNVEANGFRNVRLRNCCAGRQTGEASFFLNHGSPNSFSLRQEDNAASISVLCVSLDDLCKWERLERVDYLKIDAEGAESQILEGAAEMIRRFQPIIQVEIVTGESRPPGDYLRFVAGQSANRVYIPANNHSAIAAARSLGWTVEEVNA